MNSSDLKDWMDRNDKTAVDIASALKISPNTVIRYLKGKPAHRSTLEAFKKLIAETNSSQAKEAS